LSVGNLSRSLISYINNGTDSEQDIENLIERTEQAAATTESLTSESGLKFDFAKIWEPTRGSLEEVTEDASQIQGDDDFWAKILEQSKQKEEEDGEDGPRCTTKGCSSSRLCQSSLCLVSPSNPWYLVVHKLVAGHGSRQKKPAKGSRASAASDIEYQGSNASESESGTSMDAPLIVLSSPALCSLATL
jgi:hypothetical protein